MELTDAFSLRIEPRWTRHRYLLSDGHLIDVVSPYRADSKDREAVLTEAKRLFGADKDRKIEGVALLAEDHDEDQHDKDHDS